MQRLDLNSVNQAKINDTGDGKALLKSYSIKVSTKGTEYIQGVLHNQEDIPFIVWKGVGDFYDLMRDNMEKLTGCIVEVQFKIIDFSGRNTCSLQNFLPLDDTDIVSYLKTKYNKEVYQKAFLDILKNNMSGVGYQLTLDILGVGRSDTDTWERFSTAFAAMKHHDNCPNGLLAHTYKMVYNLSVMKQLYPWLVNFTGEYSADLLFLGCAIHDIGKIDEMDMGIYQPGSEVTHRIIGLEYLYPFRDKIIEVYNEHFYTLLQSIIVQHHGEWGDKTTTVAAEIIHMLDNLDAQFTGMGENIENNTTMGTVGKTIKGMNGYLYI